MVVAQQRQPHSPPPTLPDDRSCTTVIIANITELITANHVADSLDSAGFKGKYDFLHFEVIPVLYIRSSGLTNTMNERLLSSFGAEKEDCFLRSSAE